MPTPEESSFSAQFACYYSISKFIISRSWSMISKLVQPVFWYNLSYMKSFPSINLFLSAHHLFFFVCLFVSFIFITHLSWACMNCGISLFWAFTCLTNYYNSLISFMDFNQTCIFHTQISANQLEKTVASLLIEEQSPVSKICAFICACMVYVAMFIWMCEHSSTIHWYK